MRTDEQRSRVSFRPLEHVQGEAGLLENIKTAVREYLIGVGGSDSLGELGKATSVKGVIEWFGNKLVSVLSHRLPQLSL